VVALKGRMRPAENLENSSHARLFIVELSLIPVEASWFLPGFMGLRLPTMLKQFVQRLFPASNRCRLWHHRNTCWLVAAAA
jgi:hypothetical protein